MNATVTNAVAEAAQGYAQTGWQVPIVIRSDNWEGTVYFGVHPDASQGYDPAIDTLSPPPGFSPHAYFYIDSFPNFLTTDIRSPQSSITWQLRTMNCAGKTLTLKWNLESYLEANNNESPLAFNGCEDMTECDSLVINGDISKEITFTNLTAIHQVPIIAASEKDIELFPYPNPFNSNVTLLLNIRKSGNVHVNIFDISGRFVRTICDAQLTSGRHELRWLGINSEGQVVPSGVYVCKATLNHQINFMKIYLLR